MIKVGDQVTILSYDKLKILTKDGFLGSLEVDDEYLERIARKHITITLIERHDNSVGDADHNWYPIEAIATEPVSGETITDWNKAVKEYQALKKRRDKAHDKLEALEAKTEEAYARLENGLELL
jgi:hypothetical protein